MSNSSSETNRTSPPSSPGTSKQGLLNKMSTLFGGSSTVRQKNTITNTTAAVTINNGQNGQNSNNSNNSNNITTANTISEIQYAPSQVDSLLNDEYNRSRIDSVYSSLRSGYSGHHGANIYPINNPNDVPPRTVNVENTIIQHPTPPSPPLESQESKPTLPPRRNERNLPSPPPGEHKVSPKKAQAVEKEFEDLMKEYGPTSDYLSRVINLTVEQKEMLLRSSKTPVMKKNSTFSHVTSSLKGTFRLKSKASLSQLDKQFFNESNNISFTSKSKTAPGRYRRSRASLNLNETYGKSSRSKLKSTPEYFVRLLHETHVRDLEDAEVLDLRVFLRSVVASWTTEFLSLGGYEALANLFKQMKEAPKRCPNDNRILQHLGKCLKTIMTHQTKGMDIILNNPCAFYYIRDILFGPANKKQKQVYALEISTRSLLLNILCTLATLQTTPESEFAYVHGYDVLRRLLLDRPTDLFEGGDDKRESKHTSPFPITLKTDPQEILQMIMENDPNGQDIGRDYQWDQNELKPRYTAWMRELQYTAEKHIETITFLSHVLNYDFGSAYRQIKIRQSLNVDEQGSSSDMAENNITVMTEDGVVDYIITHLRLIRTVVTKSPTSYTGYYDEREQEKMRLELMMSGFEKISRILLQCPHPIVRSSYINYLQPLLNPCADISSIRTQQGETPLQAPQQIGANYSYQTSIGSSTLFDPSISDEEDGDEYEVTVSEGDDRVEIERVYHRDQWSDQEPYDDLYHENEYLEDHFNSDEDNELSSGEISHR